MKMMNPKSARKDLPLLLPKGPTTYEAKFNSLKQNSDIDLDEWKSNYINYNTYVTNNSLKKEHAKSDNTINKNRNSAQGLRNTLNKDIKENDKVLFSRIKTLEKLKKELVNNKIEYDKLLHSANASVQYKNDKETQYTETTVRLLLQLLGILIAGGIVYKVNNK
jgi:hypothetical protein